MGKQLHLTILYNHLQLYLHHCRMVLTSFTYVRFAIGPSFLFTHRGYATQFGDKSLDLFLFLHLLQLEQMRDGRKGALAMQKVRVQFGRKKDDGHVDQHGHHRFDRHRERFARRQAGQTDCLRQPRSRSNENAKQ